MFYYNLIQYFMSSSEDDELLQVQARKIKSEEVFEMSLTTKIIITLSVCILLLLGIYNITSLIKDNATLVQTNEEIIQVNNSNAVIDEQKNAAQQEIAKGVTQAISIIQTTSVNKETIVATIKAVEEKAKPVTVQQFSKDSKNGSKTSTKQDVIKEPLGIIGSSSAESLVELSNIIDTQIASLPDL